MGDTEQIRDLAGAVTGRTICPDCADVLLALLDAVRASRENRDAAAGAAALTDHEGVDP